MWVCMINLCHLLSAITQLLLHSPCQFFTRALLFFNKQLEKLWQYKMLNDVCVTHVCICKAIFYKLINRIWNANTYALHVGKQRESFWKEASVGTSEMVLWERKTARTLWFWLWPNCVGIHLRNVAYLSARVWLWGLVYGCVFNEPTRSLYPEGKKPIKSAINSCLSQADLQVSSKTLCVFSVCVFIWGNAVRQFPSDTITICLGAQYHNYSPHSPFFPPFWPIFDYSSQFSPHKSCIPMIYGYYSMYSSYI